MQIAKNKAVTIHYTLKDSSGEVIDSSSGQEPLAYLHGFQNIVTGLESALQGRKAGDKFDVVVSPAEGYGEHNPEQVHKVSREAFEGITEIQPGMQFEAETPEGDALVTVLEVSESDVTIDTNHPLAGIDLHFSIEIVDVRDATSEELTHGHIHGPGGHVH